MKNFLKIYKKKILISVTCISLCICLFFSSVFFVSAEDVKTIDYNKTYDDAFYPIVGFSDYSESYFRLSFYSATDIARPGGSLINLGNKPRSDLDGFEFLQSTMPSYPSSSDDKVLVKNEYVPWLYMPNVMNTSTTPHSKYSNNFGCRFIFGKTSKRFNDSTVSLSTLGSKSCFMFPKDYTINYRFNFYMPQITTDDNFKSTYVGLRFYYNDGTYLSSFPVVDYTELVYYIPDYGYNNRPYTSVMSGPNPEKGYPCLFVSVVGSVTVENRGLIKSVSFQLRDIPGAQYLDGLAIDRLSLFLEYVPDSWLSSVSNWMSNLGDTVVALGESVIYPIAGWLSDVTSVIRDGFEFIVNLFSFLGDPDSFELPSDSNGGDIIL